MDSKALKLQLDVFHLQMLEGNLTNRIQELLPFTGWITQTVFLFSRFVHLRSGFHLGHIQISQAPNRHEPGAPGEIDYHYVLDLLQQSDYSGYIGLEYRPKTDTNSSLDWITKWGYVL